MADEKKKKRKPRTVITHRHDDGTFHHEHRFDGGDHEMFAGTSSDVPDVQQHMADAFGGGAGGAAEPDAGAAAAPAPPGE
jgi:hypothetical protein